MASGSSKSDAMKEKKQNPYKFVMQQVVATLCAEVGFSAVHPSVLDILTNMLTDHLIQIGSKTREMAEISCRSRPTLPDAVLGMIECGVEVTHLPGYAHRANKMPAVVEPKKAAPPSKPRTLQVGKKQPRPDYVPPTMPEFPDPRTYIKTPALQEPQSDYFAARKKYANQKRDLLKNLIRFMAKTGETQSLWRELRLPRGQDPYPCLLPTAASNTSTVVAGDQALQLPYLNALLPAADEVVEDPASLGGANGQGGTEGKRKEEKSANKGASQQGGAGGGGGGTETEMDEESKEIDNPFLRPVKYPGPRQGKLRKQLSIS